MLNYFLSIFVALSLIFTPVSSTVLFTPQDYQKISDTLEKAFFLVDFANHDIALAQDEIGDLIWDLWGVERYLYWGARATNARAVQMGGEYEGKRVLWWAGDQTNPRQSVQVFGDIGEASIENYPATWPEEEIRDPRNLAERVTDDYVLQHTSYSQLLARSRNLGLAADLLIEVWDATLTQEDETLRDLNDRLPFIVTYLRNLSNLYAYMADLRWQQKLKALESISIFCPAFGFCMR